MSENSIFDGPRFENSEELHDHYRLDRSSNASKLNGDD